MNRTVRCASVLMSRMIIHLCGLGGTRGIGEQERQSTFRLAVRRMSVPPLTRSIGWPADSPALAGKRVSWAKFELSSPVKAYSSETGQFEPLLIIECRGLEFVGFDPMVFLRRHYWPLCG